jgi:hypothetical protein
LLNKLTSSAKIHSYAIYFLSHLSNSKEKMGGKKKQRKVEYRITNK